MARPSAPFILSILGGVFILLGGLVEFSLYASNSSSLSFFGIAIWLAGITGVVLGPGIILFAALFYQTTSHTALYGSLILGFSVASFFSFGGGLFFGLVLGVVGGILTIVWKPTPVWMGYYPAIPPIPTFRTCLKCGRAVPLDSRFCAYCGNTLV
jgi:uncharacterized protein DUF6114